MKEIIQETLSIISPREKTTGIKLAIATALLSVADIVGIVALLWFIHGLANHASQQIRIPALQSISVGVLSIFIFFTGKTAVGLYVNAQQYTYLYNIAGRLQRTALEQYLNSSFSSFTETDPAVHSRKINQQPIEFAHHVLGGLQQVVTEMVLISLSVVAIAMYNSSMLLMLAGVLMPAVALLYVVVKRKLRDTRAKIRETGELSLQYLQEAISGFVDINIYQKQQFFIGRYAKKQSQQNSQLAKLLSIQSASGRFIELAAVLGVLVLILVGSGEVSSQHLLLDAGAFAAAGYKIIPSVVRIANSISQVKTFSFSLKGLPHPNEVQSLVPKAETNKISSIQFCDVSFHRREKQILQDFNIDIQSGDMVALCGDSGKGKTTIINMLLGFIKPDAGSVIFNGRETGMEERRAWWPSISYVPQQSFMLHDSVNTNISFAHGRYNDPEVSLAMFAAGIDAGENAVFPNTVSASGRNISGGQQQRIMVARALYKNADMIILDEPFNELDDESARFILQHFRKMADSGKIILLVTHNANHISYCNKVYSLHG